MEVDTGSPASNPFAARLAMTVMLDLDGNAANEIKTSLQEWLAANQHEDGDWHLSAETRSGTLAPWFEAWTSPSLNPACCVAGLANRLGIATPAMLDRVSRLFTEKGNLDDARTGDFYGLLPYVEYVGGVEWPERDQYLDAIAANIAERGSNKEYDDAGHFWEHVVGGGPDLAERIPNEVLTVNVDALLAEQQLDGGWPTPYDEAWRPYFSAEASTTLARLRDGI